MHENKEKFWEKNFHKLNTQLQVRVLSFLPAHELFAWMRSAKKFYQSEYLWQTLLIKAFLINEEEGKSIENGQCFALSRFTSEEFKQLKEIEQLLWTEVSVGFGDEKKSLFEKIQSLNVNEGAYKTYPFSREETKILKSLLGKSEFKKLSLKLLNRPKEIFQEKIKALKESIGKIEEVDEKLKKSITRFLVTGELKEDDKFLSDKKLFIPIYDIALEHKTVLSLKILNVQYLSTPEGQGEYVARWLLENLDFPFKRETDQRIEKSDKTLFDKMLPRKQINFQTKESENAIFSVYSSKDENLTAKGLTEDQCKMQVLNFINLRFYENSNMDTEHATAYEFFAKQLDDLLNYLNDENNADFKKGFLGLEETSSHHNTYKISDFFAEDEKNDGQVKVTKLLCTLAYNNSGNLWLLSHAMNTKKSKKNSIKWLESLGEFGKQCLNAIKEAGGLHEGPLMQWVYHADKDLSFEMKFSDSDSKTFKVPAVINEKTLERDTPKGLGQFIVEWFLTSDVGKIQKDLSSTVFTQITNPIRQELFALRDLFGDKSFALSKFSAENFKDLKNITMEEWKKANCDDENLFTKIQAVKTDEAPEAYKDLLFSDEEIAKIEKALNFKGFTESVKNLVKKTKEEKFEEYKKYKKDIERKVIWLTAARKNLKKEKKTEPEHFFELDLSSSHSSQEETYIGVIQNKMLEWWGNYDYEKYIRSKIKILLEAFFPGDEEKRKGAKKALIGEIKEAKLASLSTEEIKFLANAVKEMVKEMLEENKHEFKTPENKPKPKLKEAYKGKFSEFSKKFIELTKTKEQRLEEENKKLKEENEEKDKIIEEKDEKLKKLEEENKRLKRERESNLPSSKEKKIEPDEKKQKKDVEKENLKTKNSFSSIITKSPVTPTTTTKETDKTNEIENDEENKIKKIG